MERPESYTILLVLGAAMVLSGIGIFSYWYFKHWRRRTRDERPTGGAGEFMMANAFFHFGMLILVLGGVGLIYFSSFR